MNHSRNRGKISDGIEMKIQVETHEYVSWKSRFNKPNRPPNGCAANPNARVENLKSSDFCQSDSSDMLMFRMSLHAKPQPIVINPLGRRTWCACGIQSHTSHSKDTLER